MKKILSLLFALLFIFALSLTISAASVVPVEYPGNDANSYSPPEGCVRTTLPDSDTVGTHIYKFNNQGQLDPAGTNIFTINVGIAPSTSYTQVLSWAWEGTGTLFAVIVKGGPGFNLYEYNGTLNTDTNLVSPVNESGNPADISHVSVVICPNGEPPVPPDGNIICCIISLILLLIIVLLLISILLVLCNIKCCVCKHHKKPPCQENDFDC